MAKKSTNIWVRRDPVDCVVRSPKWGDSHYQEALEAAAVVGRPICGAYNRQRGICRNRPDPTRYNGRCRFHGSRAGRPLKTGRYSRLAGFESNFVLVPEIEYRPDIAQIDDELSEINEKIRAHQDAMASGPRIKDDKRPGMLDEYTLLALYDRKSELLRERNEGESDYYLRLRDASRAIDAREKIIFSILEEELPDTNLIDKIRFRYREETGAKVLPIGENIGAWAIANFGKQDNQRERAELRERYKSRLCPGEWERIQEMVRDERRRRREGLPDPDEEDE